MTKTTLALLLAPTLACGAGPGTTPTVVTNANADARCNEYQTDIEEVWSAEAKLELRAQVTVEGEDLGGGEGSVGWNQAKYHRITTGMDASSQDWSRMVMQACSDMANDFVDRDVYQERMSCLYQWLSGIRTAIQASGDEQTESEIDQLWMPVVNGVQECYSADNGS